MRFFIFFFISLASFFLLSQPAFCQDLAAWVVRFDIDSREEIEKLCSQARKNKFDRLLVQVRGRADAFYQSEFVPRAEGLDEGFDPLAEVLNKCKGIEIDAWLNVFYLWTGDDKPLDASHPALQKLWIIKDRTGRPVDTYTSLEQSQRWIEGVYADPASEEFRLYFSKVVAEIVNKYPVRGIHLDFIRYPGAYFGTGGALAREFEKEYGFAVSELPERITPQDFASWVNGSLSLHEQQLIAARFIWDYRRSQEVTKTVALVRKTLLQVRPGVRLSASVFPDPLAAFFDKGQDWPAWLQRGVIDELFIMDYFGDPKRVKALYRDVVGQVGKDDRIWLGLGAYIKSVNDIAEEVALCAGDKQGTCFFSLGHLIKQEKSIEAYADIVHKQPNSKQLFRGEDIGGRLSGALQQLKKCVAGKRKLSCNILGKSLQFANDGQRFLPERRSTGRVWVDLRGIFRYVSAHDSFETAEEQYDLALESHEFLLSGVPFDEVAEDYSQAGSRYHGGLLPRRYLQKGDRIDDILAELKPGQFSPVLPVYNGFWVYQLIAKGHM